MPSMVGRYLVGVGLGLVLSASARGQALQEQIDAAVERVMPSVVQIDFDDSLGTGFVAHDGMIVTNHHVVEQAGEGPIEVICHDGRRVDAELLYQERHPDLAVLRILDEMDPPLEPLVFGDMTQVRPGLLVVAVGHPGGMEFSVSLGVISAVGRPGENPLEYYLQTDAAINAGNSGGPLVDLRGEVVGVNTSKLVEAGGQRMDNISFALAGNIAERVVKDIVTYGQLMRPYLGFTRISELSGLEARELGVERGALQVQVTEGGPSHRAGLRDEDVITAIDGRPIRGTHGFWVELHQHEIGEAAVMAGIRDGEPYEVELVLAPRRAGFAWREVGIDVAGGLDIREVAPGSVFATAGIRIADRIVQVRHGQEGPFDEISSLGDLKKAVKRAALSQQPLGVVVLRGGEKVELEPVDFSSLMRD